MGICVAFLEYIVSFLTKYAKFSDHTAYKIAITTTYTTLFVAAVTAYVTSAKALMNGLVSTIPDFMIGPMSWIMPPNTGTCLTAIVGCYLLRFFTKQYFRLFEVRHRAAISN